MKILISGSSGFVGSRVLHQWQGRAELFTFPRGSLAAADESAIRRFAETVQPDVILHLAALSDTGYCQQHPEESRRANVELPIWMAKAARDTGAKLISFSSDQVYAGVTQPGPLPETLPLSPANTYGQHKLEAEERVLALCPEAVLLRAPWMYDLPGNGLPLRGNLPLNLLMIPKWGVYGAIAATYISYLLCYIVRIVDARRYVPFRVNHLLFAANNVILLGMSTAIIKMPQRYVLYLVCGVGLILALNYEAIIVTAKKILKR